jgi:hypothetical protein
MLQHVKSEARRDRVWPVSQTFQSKVAARHFCSLVRCSTLAVVTALDAIGCSPPTKRSADPSIPPSAASSPLKMSSRQQIYGPPAPKGEAYLSSNIQVVAAETLSEGTLG